jgi:hypothetical protein
MQPKSAFAGTSLCVVGNINRDIKPTRFHVGENLFRDGETPVASIIETLGGGGADKGAGYYEQDTLIVEPPAPVASHVNTTGTGDVLSVCMMLLHRRDDLPIRALHGAVWHVHAKDTDIQEWNSRVNGVLDTKHYGDELNRSWMFRTVGFGSSRQFWCDFISALRMTGYDHALSIEHEDSLMTAREGLEKAIRFLQGIVLQEPKGAVTWA